MQQLTNPIRELTLVELCAVSGGTPGGSTGTLREPITDPQSEFGKSVNDVARALNDFGTWLGGAIYEATH